MANNKYNLSKEYQFDITVTDNTYAGKLALPYVTAAVKSPDTVAKGYVRQIDGLNSKAVISNLGISDPMQHLVLLVQVMTHHLLNQYLL